MTNTLRDYTDNIKAVERPTWSKYCSRKCYNDFRLRTKICKDCGKDRCPLHAKMKSARWRQLASKQDLKAKSMQVPYRTAADRSASLSLDEARKLILNPPNCPYCNKPIPWQDLSIDHRIPRSRGGSSSPENLVWVDITFNLIKGDLLDSEYLTLCGFMEMHPELKEHLTTRLRAGGGAIFSRK